ncbi:extracellular solute-binding protein [Paenibacillus sp. UASWS1643]|uniref:extracellular solute-binding protein n=1 Tax=Paenibacillus sp. UASWS1643 TaxID=2580422 RepID=UPI00123BDBE2|nr:extracellular solute-binding protein [Paenibacillus sp. UASWS1643]KAA8746153.1 extracellular solute-binding protein [Paenibacillus sp. UASWS1643]
MSWRKIYLLLTVLCLTLFTACDETSPQPNPTEQVVVLTTVKMDEPTIVYKNGETASDNVHIRWAKNKLGVDIHTQWSAPEDDYDIKLRLMLSSDDPLPDVFSSTLMDTTNKFLTSGKVLDIGKAFDKYASPTWKAAMAEVPEAWQPFTVNGKRMAIPIITEQGSQAVLWIRQDWLDKLHLEAPNNLDELETIMRAFTYDDPDGNGINDTYGINFSIKDQYLSSPTGDISWVFGAFGVIPEIWSKDERGQLVYGSIQPEIKKALLRLRSWQNKGFMGSDIALQDFSQVNENVIAGKVGIVAAPSWFADYPVKQLKARDSQAEFIPYPIPTGPDGTAGRLAGNSYSSALIISKDISEEALQAFFKYQNYLYEATVTDNPFFLSAYQNGYDYILNQDGSVSSQNSIVPGGTVTTFKYTLFNQYASYPSRIKTAILKLGKGDKLSSHDRAILFSMGVDPNNPDEIPVTEADVIEATQEEVDQRNLFQGPSTKTMQSRNSYLQKIELDTFNSIIYGDQPIESFDEFVNKWLESGGKQITDEVNEWYRSIQPQ